MTKQDEYETERKETLIIEYYRKNNELKEKLNYGNFPVRIIRLSDDILSYKIDKILEKYKEKEFGEAPLRGDPFLEFLIEGYSIILPKNSIYTSKINNLSVISIFSDSVNGLERLLEELDLPETQEEADGEEALLDQLRITFAVARPSKPYFGYKLEN